jgi:serine/threonine-protein kinase
MNLEVGSIVGDYQIVEVLGAGGMGKVFKVRNTISNRLEAMKILLPDLSGEPELADRFLREIQVLARLEHPNIAGLRTAVRFENQLLMLMELVDGMPLDKRMRQGPMPVPVAVRCIDQVLSALAYAHENGVIHRDIKPANMMLTPDGTVKLMDFGIAKGAEDRKLTMTGGTMGSVYYMSPEQIRGTEVVDARSDLYSVGVSLYELVTGKHAFDGDSQFAILGAHLEKTPVAPITLDPKVPPALNDLILLSVAREPERRFQTAAAFRNALKSVAGAAVMPEAPTRVAETRPMVPGAAAAAAAAAPPAPVEAKSHRALWATIGALCFVAVLVGAIQFGPWKKAAADSPQTPASAPPKQELVVTPTAPSTPAAEVPPANTPAATSPAPAMIPAVTEPVGAKGNGGRAPGRPAQQATGGAPAVTTQPTPAQQTPVQQTPVQQAPVVQAPVQQPAAEPQPDNQAAQRAQRAALQKVRESMVMVSARANSIHGTLQGIQRSQAASGLGMRSDWQQMASLMDSFLQGTNDALSAGDATAAKDLLDKAERQVERLEKALNK